MKRAMMWAMAALLAAGGAAAAAEKEAAIDWPARAATVKVGMTRADVEKILPRWVSPKDLEKRNSKTIHPTNGLWIFGSKGHSWGIDEYQVAEGWFVRVEYSGESRNDLQASAPVKIEKLK